MKFTFGGESTTTYAEYIDADRQSTLVAEPGGTYDVAQAAGVTRPDEKGEHQAVKLPMPPDDRWKKAAAGTPTEAEKAAKAAQQGNDEGTAG